ncbi:MAG: acyl-[acyl-carrier-protein] desaturase, partial [Mycobacterium sp.]|nr:acyl-[acyl-carrier-protein] desaturase [Mycobacterium sp.]
MAQDLTDLHLLHELEPVVEKNINRHLSMRKDWNPHDYIPWSDGKNYYALGGQDWDPEQSKLSEVAQTAMLQNLLTEDNLPSYHREIAMNFSMDGAWGQWVNRWTAEENRHGIALRDYLVVTRAIDPVELEQLRVEQVTRGFSPGQGPQGEMFAESLFDSVIYVTFQELATRVSHRNTGKACNEMVADQLLQRVSADENLHMIFYRDVSAAGFDIAPDQAMRSLHRVLRNF